ncbi:hypothetical protein DQ783_28985, partial [Salmonella enterica subsp. enterica serovar Newport]|nr:hypothetical protein [Salmonella enterica subsp. enterica serovar Newport]
MLTRDIAGNNIRKSPHSAYLHTPQAMPLPCMAFFIYLNVNRRFPMGLDVYFIKRPADTTTADTTRREQD